MNDDRLLHHVAREDDKIYYELVVPQTLNKYIFYHVHKVLGHNDAARFRFYQYLTWVSHCKGL